MPPQANPRASWPSNDDQTAFNLVVILVGLGVGSYLLWTNFHGQISQGVMALRHWEMQLLGHITDRFAQADAQMARANPYRVTLRDLLGISDAIGRFWRSPACIFILLLAAVCAVRAAPSRFKRAFDLDGLIREQARSFPSTAAFVGRKLRLASPPEGDDPRPADPALTAEEWVERYALDTRGGFDEARARAALVRQLGPRWAGPESAAPALKVLFVIFALHLDERRADAVELLGRVSAALADTGARSPDGPEAALAMPAGIVVEASALLADPEAFAKARQVAAGHAYALPALMSVLVAARRRHGVLAPSQFAWAKLVDRPLWYALHSLGFEADGVGRYLNPNPCAEAAGTRDHWAVERAAGEPVWEPDLERALLAIQRIAASLGPSSPSSPLRRRDAT